MVYIWQSQSGRAADHARSLSVGNGPRPENLGAASLSGSETSILSQAMARAKQLEEEEKAERTGENFYVLNRDFVLYITSKCMTTVCSFKVTQTTRIHVSVTVLVFKTLIKSVKNWSDFFFALSLASVATSFPGSSRVRTRVL